ncbi:MAG: ABC-2 family transporter protein [Chloroflexi bacterium]|nr:ABC-2 family transporter protein [Chloroflexota bacterium]
MTTELLNEQLRLTATSVRTFLRLAAMIFRQHVTYRVEWLFGIFHGLLFLWIQVAIWRALLGPEGERAATLGATASDSAAGTPITASDMVTYLVAARVVSAVVGAGVARDMESRLRTGHIVNDLLRPTGFPFMVLGRSLGQTAGGLLSHTLPVVVLAHFIWGLQPPGSLSGLVAAAGTVGVALVISYAIAYLLGILGFWVWTTEHFEWVVFGVIHVLSGAAIPYWFLPDWLRAVGSALPFHVMGYTPVALYLGKMPAAEATALIAIGCA